MKFNLSIALLFLSWSFAAAQTRIETIDAVLNRLNREEAFSGNVLISEKDKIIYAKSFGYANAETKTPLTPETIFLIGSVAKTLTAVAVLQLKEQGKLTLDDSLARHLPELPYKNVTLRHLLTHTSGVLEYQSPEVIKEIAGRGVGNAELVNIFARLNPKLEFAPGSRWDYSNTNFILLARVVEKISNKNFPQFVRENIFVPARMTRSFVGINNAPAPLKKTIAAGYRFTNPLADAAVNVETLEGARQAYATKQNLYGAGNVFSTTVDLLKFHRALQRGKLLKKQTLAEMYSPAKLSTGENYNSFSRTNYPSGNALGWFAANDESRGIIVYHPGGDIGYTSYFLRNTTKDQTVIILSNIELLRHYTPTALMKILSGEPYKLDLKSLAAAMGREYNRRGARAMLEIFARLKTSDEYSFSEDEINELGYRLLYDKKDLKSAEAVFKLNAERFPESYNVWDSLGEVYFQIGDKEEAVKNYEKSLRLNPKNEGGKRMLEKIRRGEKP
ncbi:MAG TPA: serine hydrolase [Pyrinomonadaceae bacterium]|jgi:CubicO group peptidase (beta-lactamase class C family)